MTSHPDTADPREAAVPTTEAGRLIFEWLTAMRLLGVPDPALVLDIEKQAAAKVRADLIERVEGLRDNGTALDVVYVTKDGEPQKALLIEDVLAILRDDKENR